MATYTPQFDELMERVGKKQVFVSRIELDVQSKVSEMRDSLKKIDSSLKPSEKKKRELKKLFQETMVGKYKLDRRDTVSRLKRIKKIRTEIKMLSGEVLPRELEAQIRSLSLALDSYVEGVREHREIREAILLKIQ